MGLIAFRRAAVLEFSPGVGFVHIHSRSSNVLTWNPHRRRVSPEIFFEPGNGAPDPLRPGGCRRRKLALWREIAGPQIGGPRRLNTVEAGVPVPDGDGDPLRFRVPRQEPGKDGPGKAQPLEPEEAGDQVTLQLTGRLGLSIHGPGL